MQCTQALPLISKGLAGSPLVPLQVLGRSRSSFEQATRGRARWLLITSCARQTRLEKLTRGWERVRRICYSGVNRRHKKQYLALAATVQHRWTTVSSNSSSAFGSPRGATPPPGELASTGKVPDSELDARLLNQAIVSTRSLDELLEMVASRGHQFNDVNVATAFQRVAKGGAELPESTRERLREDPRVCQLAALVESKLPVMGRQGLANVAWAHSQLQHGGPSLMLQVAEEVVRKRNSFLPQEVVALHHAYAKYPAQGPQLFSAFAEIVCHLLPQFQARQLATLAWAYTKAGFWNTDLMQQLGEEALRRLKFFDPQSLSTLAWAYAASGHKFQELFDGLEKHVLKTVHRFGPQDISNTAWSFARQGAASPALLQALAQQAVKRLPDFGIQAASNTAWAYATLGHYNPELLDKLAAKCAAECSAELNPQAIANIAWPYASLTHYTPELLDALTRASLPLLHRFNPHNLSSLIFALATFGHQPREPFLSAFSAEVLRRLKEGEFNKTLSEFQVEGVTFRDSSEGQGLPRQSLVNIAWGLVVLGCMREDLFPWLRAATARVPDYSSSELNQLYQVELALRLEAPGMGEEPLQVESTADYLKDLWLSGDTKYKAKMCWELSNEMDRRQVSAFQKDVAAILRGMGVELVEEHRDRGEYSMDIALIGPRVAIEADGPSHFAANVRRPLGPTLLKRRLLERLGWSVVQLPYYDWMELQSQKGKETYLEGTIGKDILSMARACQDEASPQPSEGSQQESSREATTPESDQPRSKPVSKEEVLARSERMKVINVGRAPKGDKLGVLRGIAVRRGIVKRDNTESLPKSEE